MQKNLQKRLDDFQIKRYNIYVFEICMYFVIIGGILS